MDGCHYVNSQNNVHLQGGRKQGGRGGSSPLKSALGDLSPPDQLIITVYYITIHYTRSNLRESKFKFFLGWYAPRPPPRGHRVWKHVHASLHVPEQSSAPPFLLSPNLLSCKHTCLPSSKRRYLGILCIGYNM